MKSVSPSREVRGYFCCVLFMVIEGGVNIQSLARGVSPNGGSELQLVTAHDSQGLLSYQDYSGQCYVLPNDFPLDELTRILVSYFYGKLSVLIYVVHMLANVLLRSAINFCQLILC